MVREARLLARLRESQSAILLASTAVDPAALRARQLPLFLSKIMCLVLPRCSRPTQFITMWTLGLSVALGMQ